MHATHRWMGIRVKKVSTRFTPLAKISPYSAVCKKIMRLRMVEGMESSKRIVVVGGGVGGVTVAARLAKERPGWDVLLLEKNEQLGGRLDTLRMDGFRWDTGPTLLLAPGIYRAAFDILGRGRRMEDWTELRRVEPAYRVFLSDNTPLALTSDMSIMREQLEALEPGCFHRFLVYMEEARINFEKGFASRPFQSPDNSIWVLSA